MLRVTSAPAGMVAPEPFVLAGEGAVLIGRGGDATWILPDRTSRVSREHAEITAGDGSWIITDRSSNGTMVDGRLLRRGEQAAIAAGSQIEIGDYRLAVADPASDGAQAFEPDWSIEARIEESPRLQPDQLDVDDNVFERDSDGAQPPDEPGNWFDKHESNLGKLIAQDLMSLVPLSEPSAQDQQQADDVGHDAPPVADSVPGVGDDAVLQAFLAGAGLTSVPEGVSATEAMRVAGSSLRILIEAMASLIAARSALKGEFRVSKTQLGSEGNNPLKFTSDVGEMMQFALGMKRPGYLGGGSALAEAGRDIAIHQLAMVTAFRALISALFNELSPGAVTKAANEELKGLGRLVPGRVEAEQWARFAATYEQLAKDFGQSFDGRLGRLFASAYEDTADREAGARARR
jgi:type VI secretion system FHA domain protein